MKYYYDTRAPVMVDAELIRVDREKLDPLGSGSFLSIAYYLVNGELIGIVF